MNDANLRCPNCPHPIEDHNINGCNGPWRCDCGYSDYQLRDQPVAGVCCDQHNAPKTCAYQYDENHTRYCCNDCPYIPDTVQPVADVSEWTAIVADIRDYGEHDNACIDQRKYPDFRDCSCWVERAATEIERLSDDYSDAEQEWKKWKAAAERAEAVLDEAIVALGSEKAGLVHVNVNLRAALREILDYVNSLDDAVSTSPEVRVIAEAALNAAPE